VAQQHVRMKRCLQAIEKMEAAAGDEYHLIVRTRMDAKWFAPLPRASLARLLNANASHPLVLTPSDQVAGPLCLPHRLTLCVSYGVSLTASPSPSLLRRLSHCVSVAWQAWGGINDRFVMTTRPGFVAYAELFRNLIRKEGPFAAGWSKKTNHTDFGELPLSLLY
jgi:hypothetical protein